MSLFNTRNSVRVDENGRPFTVIGPYHVIKESENMTGIYLYKRGKKELITSKPKWSHATKLAMLLSDAYQEGIANERHDSFWDD